MAPSRLNDLPILTPLEIEEKVIAILGKLEHSPLSQEDQFELTKKLKEFQNQWQKVFAKFGQDYGGELTYRDLIAEFSEKIAPLAKKEISLSGQEHEEIDAILAMLPSPNRLFLPLSQRLFFAKKKFRARLESENQLSCPIPVFEKPIFIVSAPRAGSSLLFETLAQFPNLWTIGDESHEIIEGVSALHPSVRKFSSNCLDESDLTPEISMTLRKRFTQQLQNREGVSYVHLTEDERPTKIRFLEKTPKNALRVPFLKALFPDALFIYLYREAKENISSLLEGWRSQRFVSYKSLPGWNHRQWSFLLVPGWSSLQESSLVEIAAYQWKMANSYLIEDLKTLPASSWCLVNYRDLVEQPQKTITDIAQFAQLHLDQHIEQMLSQPLPIAQRTLSAPSSEKWRKHERELATVLPNLENLIKTLEKGNL